MTRRTHSRKSGQIVVALVVMLLALAVLALMNVDTFISMSGKARMTNAGDAAALAAAHWQGVTLNLIGDLNLARINALSASTNNSDAAMDNLAFSEVSAGILALQERLAIAGPVMALHSASAAAEMNFAGADSNMTDIVNQSIALASEIEPEGTETWPTKWKDYAAMLREARGSDDKLFAGCANARLFDLFSNFSDGHMLHNKAFYEAVIGRDWCWFSHRRLTSLLRNFRSWSPLGDAIGMDSDNPEYFGLAIRRDMLDPDTLRDIILELAAIYNLPNITEETMEYIDFSVVADLPWFMYDLGTWRDWDEMDPNGHNFLPVMSPPKDEYNVLGATAAVSTGVCVGLFTPNMDEKVGDVKDIEAGRFITEERLEAEKEKMNLISAMMERKEHTGWNAAAKPFGFRETASGRERVTRFNGMLFPLITPDFSAVRLIPLDGASGGNLSTADAGWVRHLREHLLEYMSGGQSSPGCKWCSALKQWDNPAFRQSGVEWLKHHIDKCNRKGGHGGSTPQGGTRHAH